jgi:hypothetical protein
MNRLQSKNIILLLVAFVIAMPFGRAQSFDRPPAPKSQKHAAHNGPLRHKNVKGPANIEKVKKQQEEKKSKQKKDFAKYVKENQKRSIEIQTPEVKERMKQNIKDANSNYDSKHKNSASKTRKAGRKYK